MNRIVTFALPSFLLLAHATLAYCAASPSLIDSVGVERKDGKRFVLHRVDQGQTLYAVARRYGATVDAIKSANPDLADNTVRYDQLLRVPVAVVSVSRREQREAEKALRKEEKENQKVVEEAEQATSTDDKATAKTDPKAKSEKSLEKTARIAAAPSNGIHVVETGQTLYSLAVRYNVTMADIRRWNDLGADGIQVGKPLIVTEKAYEAKKEDDSPIASTAKTRPAPAKSADSEPVRLEAKPIITPDPLPTPGSKPKAKTTDTKPPERVAEPKITERGSVERGPTEVRPTEPRSTEPRSTNEPAAGVRKGYMKADIGFADVIEGNDASTKYLALHRSAPVGALVQVRNDITNQSLYVKVIGKLPDTGINNQVLIRLSARAFEKLSPNGQRFRAEVSYSN